MSARQAHINAKYPKRFRQDSKSRTGGNVIGQNSLSLGAVRHPTPFRAGICSTDKTHLNNHQHCSFLSQREFPHSRMRKLYAYQSSARKDGVLVGTRPRGDIYSIRLPQLADVVGNRNARRAEYSLLLPSCRLLKRYHNVGMKRTRECSLSTSMWLILVLNHPLSQDTDILYFELIVPQTWKHYSADTPARCQK